MAGVGDYVDRIRRRMGNGVDVIVTTLGGEQTARAVRAGGGLVGMRSSETPPEGIPIEFVDWPFMLDNPSIEAHVDAVRSIRPKYAVAPDIDGRHPVSEVIEVGDRLDKYAQNVIVVPKVEPVDVVPDRFVVGVPFRNEWDTDIGVNEYIDFAGRPVHILGGNPTGQIELARRFDYDVLSVDSPNVLAWADAGRVWVARLGGADSVRRLIVDDIIERSFDADRAEQQVRNALLGVEGVPDGATDDTLIQLLGREAVGELSPDGFLRTVGADFLQEEAASAEAAFGVPSYRRLLSSRFARIQFSVQNLIQAWNEGFRVTRRRPIAPGRGPPPPMDEPIEAFGETLSVEEQRERFADATVEEEVGRVVTERGLATFDED